MAACLLVFLAACGDSGAEKPRDASGGGTGGGQTAGAQDTRVLSLLPGLAGREETGPEFLKRTPWEKGWGDMSRIRVDRSGLLLTCQGDRVVIGYRAEPFPLDLSTRPFLQFALQVEEIPPEADLSRKATDDSCFRLVLVFGEESLLHTPPMIAYTWAAREAPDTILTSPHYDQIKYLVIGKGKPEKQVFFRFVRNVVADYHRAFGGARPPAIHGVVLKFDTNQLGGRGRCRLRYLALARDEEWCGPQEAVAPPGQSNAVAPPPGNTKSE